MQKRTHLRSPQLRAGLTALLADQPVSSASVPVSPMFAPLATISAPPNDALTPSFVSSYIDVPTLTDENLVNVAGVSRASVRSGLHRLAVARKPAFEKDCFLRHVFAWKSGLLMLDVGSLPSGHWAEEGARYLDEEAASFSISGQTWFGSFEGEVVRTTVRLCESFEIWVGRDVVSVTDAPIYVEGKGIVVPIGAIDPGRVMEMVCDYEGDESALEYDQVAFAEYVRRIRKHLTVNVFGRTTLGFESELLVDSYAALSGQLQ